ncbi:NAD(P)-dependent oxidoreductase [Marivirga tractuosa]|uniref:NmrA family protein n=1 Tax=Marivirga tractuosa (strain ATCC 23168 / DSM 4126 / NBRC 15989 / NCIMB 1408 / VKM B-1430 / H-43) TaxID=643867 RepID=E4TM44_MARTH|nr:NmrA family NAD(P)-binding protein [Marivirga tractuosa]ADR21320.1 NmrA family protein [Marivirga tractuosa DSM 4126]BDD14226.1 NAD(P)-dependent oxidoreductase [Marivirga tractuosa]
MTILITGATGNVGQAILSSFLIGNFEAKIIAGIRNPDDLKEQEKLPPPFLKQEFDFGKTEKFSRYLDGIDVLFLLRPPNIADVKAVFKPLIVAAKEANVKHIVFLSVQGAEKQSYIPHHKIEKLIVESEIPYTFLRPAYFMQNFITTLRKDIVGKGMIYLPAGDAKFTVVDVKDVGAVAAEILLNASDHQNQAYELTNSELLSFSEFAEQISEVVDKEVKFISPNLLAFIVRKLKEGHSFTYIFVLIMLHYFPRFKESPETSKEVEHFLKRKPINFREFLDREKTKLKL